jgi:aminoglycoside phosphotransferase (APT) family kinase protein/putative sterol carrier protein
MTANKDAATRIVPSLIPWLTKHMPDARNMDISDLQKPSMGLSNETYLFNLSWDEQGGRRSRPMVLRMAPQDHKVFPDYHLDHQYLIMKALRNTGVPVPEMYWHEEKSGIMGAPFYLMERLYGQLPQDYPSYHGSGMMFEASPDERAKMWWGSLETLAKVHMLDWKSLGLEFLGVPGGGPDPINKQLLYWDRYFEWIRDEKTERYPLLEKAMQWLRENVYQPERVCLCWGDARIGNTLYRVPDHRVIAALDWEMAFLGDPIADLSWFIFLDRYLSLEYGIARLEGLPTPDETIRRYEDLTGWKVKNFTYNEVFGAMRFGMILVSVMKKMKNMGVPIEEDMLQNNSCTRRIAELLGLEPPGARRNVQDIREAIVSIQFNLTGQGGHDWYIVSDKGEVQRHEGAAENPACSVHATASDWQMLQTGELDQLEAWKTGRLVVKGDLNVMILLKDDISRLSKAGIQESSASNQRRRVKPK